MHPIERIQAYIECYTEQAKSLEALISLLLPGTLHSRKNGKHRQYIYHAKGMKREYIHVKNRPIVRELALKADLTARLEDCRAELDICLLLRQALTEHPHALENFEANPEFAVLREEAYLLLKNNGTFFTAEEWMAMIDGKTDSQFRRLTDHKYRKIAAEERHRLTEVRKEQQTSSAGPEKIRHILFSHHPDARTVQIFSLLSRRSIHADDEVQDFLDAEYQSNPFRPEEKIFTTMDGEKMRSKLEVRTAELLKQLGIPYHYEQPVIIDGHKYYPDFVLMHPKTHETYILEIFGMMDDPQYAANTMRKLQAYPAGGYIIGQNLLCYSETKKTPLDFIKMKQDLEYIFL